MLWIMVCVLTGIVGGKLADMEDRSPTIWGVATALTAFVASDFMGAWFGLAPVAALAACYAGLWIMKSRDGDRGGRITR
jgi:hypothetical protein